MKVPVLSLLGFLIVAVWTRINFNIVLRTEVSLEQNIQLEMTLSFFTKVNKSYMTHFSDHFIPFTEKILSGQE